MNTDRNGLQKIHPLIFAAWFSVLFTLCGASQALADVLDIPDTPLFLGGSTPANVFLLMDDSGSMDWEILRRTETLALFPTFPVGGNLDITPTREDRDEILESCVGYNSLYFDPEFTYTPWIGNDENGNAFGNQTITAARSNPFDSDFTVDLTDDTGFGDPPGYMTWNDADGDGVFDVGECPDPGADGYDYAGQFTSTVAGFGVANVMTTAEQQNFANWFTYYRKREYVMKRAITPLINNAGDMRMGLGTLHNNNNVGTPIRDLTIAANKNTLLNNAININSDFGTPLRQRLEDAGQYYDQTDGSTSHTDLGFTDSDPFLPVADGGMCQQSFTLLLSDGFWNGGSPNIGNTDADSGNGFDGGSYADDFEDTLADVAMDFFERDLNANLDDFVPTQESRNDLNSAQHMVTYTVSFGLDGTLTTSPTDFETSFPWPEPEADLPTTTDDMQHAAWNGRGQFLSANDPDQLIEALDEVLSDIEARSGASAAAAANGGSISTESRIFQAQFNSGDWSGRLLSFAVNNTDGTIITEPVWEAGELLNNSDPSNRNIIAGDPNGTSAGPFLWASLNSEQQALLNIDPTTGEVDDLGEQRVLALRGQNQSNPEIRDRSNRLGDLINSDPEFVGAPRFLYNFDGYQEFFESNVNRRQVIYVGGNDGMLHAFNAEDGQELYSYIPGEVFENLNELTNPDYTHRFYVDGSPTYGDVQFGTGAGTWHSVLIGGLGAGGQGMYALDVTSSDSFAGSNELWEFTDEDDADLGFTFTRPQIVRMNNDKWAAVFGNGYNNTVDDGSASTTGTAALYIIFIDDARDGISAGDFIKITAGASDVDNPNGLASVGSADIDGDVRADFIYAGDLRGNLWKFDVSSANPNDWGLASGSTPLFTAVSPDGEPQSITAAPTATSHPLGINQGALILFGSGQFIETDDINPATQVTQTFYALWDREVSPIFDSADSVTRARMQQTTIGSTGDFRFVATGADPDWLDEDGNQQDLGWYLDLPVQGERVTREPIVRDGIVFFVTLIPSLEPCVPGGTGFLMALDAGSGNIPVDGQDQIDTIFDINNDGIFDTGDQVGNSVVVGLMQTGIPALPAVIFDPRPLCERDPSAPQCQPDDGNGGGSGGGNFVGTFPPPLNALRGCGSDGTRIYLYTTTSNGDISQASATLSDISCGRQAWRQRR